MDLTIFQPQHWRITIYLVEFCFFCEFVKFNGDIQILFGREKFSFSLLSNSKQLLYGLLLIFRWSVLTCGQFGPRLVFE